MIQITAIHGITFFDISTIILLLFIVEQYLIVMLGYLLRQIQLFIDLIQVLAIQNIVSCRCDLGLLFTII